MMTYRLAYRHENGEVEGFVGLAFSSVEVAHRNAVELCRKKCDSIGQTFHDSRVIRSADSLTPDEFSQVRADWKA